MSELKFGGFSIRAPVEWDTETTVVCRGPEINGYRPNIRVTCLTGEASVEDLCSEYARRLASEFAVVDKTSEASDGDNRRDMVFAIRLEDGRTAHHRVIIARRGPSIATVAASHRDDDPAVHAAIEGALKTFTHT